MIDFQTEGNLKDLKAGAKIKIKSEQAVIPLQGAVVFPGLTLPLAIGDPRSLKALDSVIRDDKVITFVALKSGEVSAASPETLYSVGTAAKIAEVMKQPDGSVRILIQGLVRARIKEFISQEPYLKVKIEPISKPVIEKTEKVEALVYSAVNQFKECINLGATVPFNVLLIVMNITDPWQLVDVICVNMDFKIEEKQKILEAATVIEKLEALSQSLGRQIKVLRMAKKIQVETGKELGKMEREMLLREQLKAIEKELGLVGGVSEIDELRKKIEAGGMPPQAKEQASKELNRLERMPSFSPEISYIRTYLDWMISLPWSKKSESKIDIKEAKRILDEDHYGLEKVKERMAEYLAVQKLVGKIRGPILCFAGPPGTGKTSIGQSIARALGRKFIRMSLGGIHDEAEIRGHRRTYVGALPGRIIQGINTAGTSNPVFMLDEIDKIGADFRGDPSAALLEALDPEQNFAFSDHYLEVPFDLSDVMFITTANILDTIPPALRDRMEVIEFPGYTEDEKFFIARKFLISKQLKNNGLDDKLIKITDEAVHRVIQEYTAEAGVRNLEREIAKIMRQVAKQVAEGKKKLYAVGSDEVSKYLGASRFKVGMAEKKDEVGVVTGLAWTPAGGDILTIEAAKMPGKGRLILTGHMGQVMQESVQAAFTYAKAKAAKLKINEKNFQNIDVHVHVPAGAIPKDGPSAGIAMATALVSILTDKKVKRGIAMTGEVTLRGRALEIGGIKEKVLAAHRARVKTVILPADNKKNLLEDVTERIRKDLKFEFVETMDDVLKIALL